MKCWRRIIYLALMLRQLILRSHVFFQYGLLAIWEGMPKKIIVLSSRLPFEPLNIIFAAIRTEICNLQIMKYDCSLPLFASFGNRTVAGEIKVKQATGDTSQWTPIWNNQRGLVTQLRRFRRESLRVANSHRGNGELFSDRSWLNCLEYKSLA